MTNHSITFSTNWNKKLDCQAFTTFRVHNPAKYAQGIECDIILKGEVIAKAVIIGVRTLKLEQINEFIAYLDTGYSVKDFKKIVRTMYKGKDVNSMKFDFVLLKKIED